MTIQLWQNGRDLTYLARMIDEAGCVSTHRRINNVGTVNTEHVATDTLETETPGVRFSKPPKLFRPIPGAIISYISFVS